MRPYNYILVAAVGMFAGCESFLQHSYHYDVGVKNIGKNMISDTKVASVKGFFDEPGVLIPNAVKITGGPFPYPCHDRFTLTWQRADGSTYSNTLDLTKSLSDSFSGDVVFTIDDNNDLDFVTEMFNKK